MPSTNLFRLCYNESGAVEAKRIPATPGQCGEVPSSPEKENRRREPAWTEPQRLQAPFSLTDHANAC
jgi:hypothetical protein